MKLLHTYAFGSLCRGEFTNGSDVDLLCAVSGGTNTLSREVFSIYSHSRLREIWTEGNPFAWHLFYESRLIYTSDGHDFIRDLGVPSAYNQRTRDCARFLDLAIQARMSIMRDGASVIFDLAAVFLALRNFSSCYVLGNPGEHDFSRNVAIKLMGQERPLSLESYSVLERARLLCTRGHGDLLSSEDIQRAIDCLPVAEKWMATRLEEVNK